MASVAIYELIRTPDESGAAAEKSVKEARKTVHGVEIADLTARVDPRYRELSYMHENIFAWMEMHKNQQFVKIRKDRSGGKYGKRLISHYPNVVFSTRHRISLKFII